MCGWRSIRDGGSNGVLRDGRKGRSICVVCVGMCASGWCNKDVQGPCDFRWWCSREVQGWGAIVRTNEEVRGHGVVVI